ncbi:uncharacterized protein EV154DRAFT_550571 [Mucor mucedo]|uniref:uncharacterized protein n=1 Tax=Mucor mucedo TaxID=29922 RepID=UPI00221E9235|nr:uncharacterized protein EV154DRAFT_550571 [Mucor mucedo]KAI7892626.1 hypothetical protein EV154DRAFT_550571 [Mucor mucedo]
MSTMSQPGSPLIEFALEKSRSAVNRDSGVGDKTSLKMYKEAVDALQNVLDDDADVTNNKSRLKTIQESYLKRIEFLSSSLQMKTSKRINASAPTTSIMISINKRMPKKEPKLDLKPSMSTPTSTTMLIKQKKKKIGNTNKNRYSSDFSSTGTPQILSRNQSSPTLHSFEHVDIEQDCFDLQALTDNMSTEKQDECKRQSADSQSTIVTNVTTTPPTELSLSSSDSTLHEDSNSLRKTFSARVIHKKSSTVVTEPFQPQMERSVSTSSFQTLLGRRKSSKKQLKSDSKLTSTVEETSKTSFAALLQNTTKLNKRTTTPSVDLGRSKSKKKWSIIGKIPPSFLDPTAFIAGPPKDEEHVRAINNDALVSLDLMNKLLQSMLHGGYITPNLYIPMDLWYQPNVRLPTTDGKIAACELLLIALERMDKRKNFSDSSTVETDLKVLEQTLNRIKYTLIKKLGYLISPGGENDPSSLVDHHHHGQSSSRYSSYMSSLIGGSSGVKTSQTLSAWSSKLSKSVERMKFEASKAIPTGEHNNDIYIKTLIRLFTVVKVLERWNTKLTLLIENESSQKSSSYKRARNTNEACINLLRSTICEFVLKDYEVLLDRWLRRSSDWIFD